MAQGQAVTEQKYLIVMDDGTIKETNEATFQALADRVLAEHNGGIVPTTDAEREAIAKRIHGDESPMIKRIGGEP